MPCIVPLGLKSLLSALILGFVTTWSRVGTFFGNLRFFDRFGKVLKLKEPKESGEFVTDFSRKMLKKKKNRRKNFPLE